MNGYLDGWMDDMRFCIRFNILVILGQWAGNNERLCATCSNFQKYKRCIFFLWQFMHKYVNRMKSNRL